MAKKFTINVHGETLPCAPTMGAMLRFHRETGRDISEANLGSLTDLCTYLWCCVVAGCSNEGRPFDLSLMDFADSLSPEDMQTFAEALAEDNPEDAHADEAKKKP